MSEKSVGKYVVLPDMLGLSNTARGMPEFFGFTLGSCMALYVPVWTRGAGDVHVDVDFVWFEDFGDAEDADVLLERPRHRFVGVPRVVHDVRNFEVIL
jgi:hypothetical protein